MPQHYTKFNDRWFKEVDSNWHKLKLWCSKGDSDTTAYWFVCFKSIQCVNSGLPQLLQHAQKCQTHIKLAKTACSDIQPRIKIESAQCSLTSQRVNSVGSSVKSCIISLSNMRTTPTRLKLFRQQRQQNPTIVSGQVTG